MELDYLFWKLFLGTLAIWTVSSLACVGFCTLVYLFLRK